jgi:hypothetical protein
MTAPSGSTGVGYQLTGLTVYIAGTPISSPAVAAGGFANPNQAAFSLTPGSPCILGTCLPLTGYVETTGAPVLVLVSPLGTMPVVVPATCVVNNGVPCPSASPSATGSVSPPSPPSPPSLPTVPPVSLPTPKSGQSTYSGVVFIGQTSSMSPPMQIVGGSGTFTYDSISCVGVHDQTSGTTSIGGTCQLVASGSYVNTICGSFTVNGTATVSDALGGFATVSFQVTVMQFHGVLTGRDDRGRTVAGYVDFLPSSSPLPAPPACVYGLTTVGALAFA